MPTFLVESYQPRGCPQELRELEARARAAARAGGGTYVRSILTPQDELCLHLFESPSLARLTQAMEAVGFGYARVTEAAEFPDEAR